jgi:branched-chain amino acid transport system substrate-binding protein
MARFFVAAAITFLLSLGTPTLALDKGPIRIGFSIAQTGPLSAAGKSGLLALEIWRDGVNARGGLLGRPVELVVYDDKGQPETVAYQTLAPLLLNELQREHNSNYLPVTLLITYA